MTDAITRFLLDGVPRVQFYEGGKRCPEDFAFPSCLRASLEFMRDHQVGCHAIRSMAREPDWPVGCTYAFYVVTSGMAFQQLWHPTNWEWYDILRMTPTAVEPIFRAFEAAGYACEVVGHREACQAMGYAADTFAQYADEQHVRQRVITSLRDKGRPVIAFGVVGPPEACLVTGYDEGGEVLIGWNFFQGFPEYRDMLTFEPNGQFRVRDWFKNTCGLVLIGDRRASRSQKEALRKALTWGAELMRTPQIHGWYSGLRALEAWAEAMEDDANFAAGDWAMRRERYALHNMMVGQVAEARWYGAVALGQCACQDVGIAEELLAAASHWAAMHDLMWRVWGCAGGIGDDDEKVRHGTEPDSRREIARLIRHAKAHDAQALAAIEQALHKLPVPYA